MPCSVGTSLCPPPPLSLSTNTNTNTTTTTPKHSYLYNTHHKLIPSFNSLNFLTISHFSPFNSTFKLNPLTSFAVQTSALCLPEEPKPETDVSNGKLRAEHLADKIREIPLQNRSKFIHAMLEEKGSSKNLKFMNDVIMGLVTVEEFDIALKVFDEMSLCGLSPNGWTYSILIRCYCKRNEPDEGKKLLDFMIENGFRPNVVTVTILVNSLCSRGKIERAFEVVEMMDRIGCNPNVQTYNCVLKGLCFVGRVEEAYKMLMSLKRKGEISRTSYTDVYSYTAVMDGFCKVGRSDEAMELLEESVKIGLTPSVLTYNTLFNGYCKEGTPRKGIRLLKQMKERGCMPDYISYSTLLHGLLKWDKILAGFWVYKEMVAVGFKVDERMMNTLLRGLCKESWIEQGLEENVDQVFNKMKTWGHTVFPNTYCLVSHTFCIAKKIDRALVIVREMIKNGYFPRMVTINRIIRGLCGEERIREALSVLVIVSEANKIPSKISYNILIDELNRQGNVVGACNVYGAALKLGVIPHNVPLCFHSK